MGERAGEDPWATLRAHPEIALEWAVLDDGPGGRWEGRRIILDPRLTRREARCVLMHELVHAERGVGWPHATAATMEREEAIVRRITASRLVPLDQLEAAVDAWGEVGPVTVPVVAAEWDVTDDVAKLACRLLIDRKMRREWGGRASQLDSIPLDMAESL